MNGLSTAAKIARKRRNLVSTQFNMFNWLLETVCLVLVMFDEKQILTIYYLGIEENRKKAREHFQLRIRIFKKNRVAPKDIVKT